MQQVLNPAMVEQELVVQSPDRQRPMVAVAVVVAVGLAHREQVAQAVAVPDHLLLRPQEPTEPMVLEVVVVVEPQLEDLVVLAAMAWLFYPYPLLVMLEMPM
jgi:hypothetical protein